MKRTVGIGTLLTLLLLALVLEGIPILHAHADEQPGLYNEECPLAELAAHTAGAPLSSPGSATVPLAVKQTPDLPAPPVLSSPLLSSTDSRAPPVC